MRCDIHTKQINKLCKWNTE